MLATKKLKINFVRVSPHNLIDRIEKLGVKKIELYSELQASGAIINYSDYSRALNGLIQTPLAISSMDKADEIVTGWEESE